MISKYPSFNTTFNEFKYLAGNRVGILNQSQIPICNHPHDVYLKSVTGEMPNYHKLMLDDNASVSYHIIGYGSHYEESFIKYVGESIERYSTIVAPSLLKDEIIYDTYSNLSKKYKVMPLEYLNVFTQNQIDKSNSLGMKMCHHMANEDDVIGFIKCPLLFEDDYMYVPAQMLFVGYKINECVNEHQHILGFSTGTAAHKSTKKALFNALVEYIQIDSFMMSWNTLKKCKRIIIDDDNINELLEKANLGSNSIYEIIPIDMSFGENNPLYTFGVILKNKFKESPYILFGVQGGLDPRHTLLRGIMEAAAISYSYYYNLLYNEAAIENINSESPQFLDLDSNVFYYAHNNNADNKSKIFDQLIDSSINLSQYKNRSKDIDSDLKLLMNYLKTISKNAVFFDFTPPETIDKGWSVMRVLIPEMLEMCIPDFPFINHPRLKEYGGVKNEFAHPMP